MHLCLSGLAIQLVLSDGRPPEDMVFGSIPTGHGYHSFEDNQIVGFHGLLAIGDNCIRRLGIHMQMDGSELKGESSLKDMHDNKSSRLSLQAMHAALTCFMSGSMYYN